jgi:hypothetical protein
VKGTLQSGKEAVARRQHGHWHTVKWPSHSAKALTTIAAASAKDVWLGGGTMSGYPAIYRWSGKKFVAAKLPKLRFGEIQSIAASSPSNAWAVSGDLRSKDDTPVALHWDGKKWSAVASPEDMRGVSTSGPGNAWGLGYNGNFVHWNGTAWAAQSVMPDVTLTDTATHSATNAYAVGGTVVGSHDAPVVLKFNGSTWTSVALPKHVAHVALTAAAMRGSSVWAMGSQLILHSDGGKWSQQLKFGSTVGLSAISASSPRKAAAAGAHLIHAGTPLQQDKTLVEAFNGHAWKGVPSSY